MNRTGQYKLVRQTGGRGYYAVVQVEASETMGGPVVEVDSRLPAWAQKEYGAAAVDGVNYALRHLGAALDLSTIHIKVVDIQEYLVDTCKGSVAFASCYATWQALGVEGEPAATGEENSRVSSRLAATTQDDVPGDRGRQAHRVELWLS